MRQEVETVEVLVRTHDRTRKARVELPKTYTTNQIIAEALGYFGESDRGSGGNFALRCARTAQILPHDATVEESGLVNEDVLELVFEHVEG